MIRERKVDTDVVEYVVEDGVCLVVDNRMCDWSRWLMWLVVIIGRSVLGHGIGGGRYSDVAGYEVEDVVLQVVNRLTTSAELGSSGRGSDPGR